MDNIQTKGRRKSAVARSTIKDGEGRIRINKRPLEVYEPKMVRELVKEPALLAKDLVEEIDIEIEVEGGGFMGQAEAARMALARGLVEYSNDPDLRDEFLEYDRSMLKGDYRTKETRKPNRSSQGARSKRQKSYR